MQLKLFLVALTVIALALPLYADAQPKKISRIGFLQSSDTRLTVAAFRQGLRDLGYTAQPAIERAKQATKTIPIVMIATFDPVATGLVDSLARPGANITGVYTLQRELSGKRLELLKEMLPGISRVGVSLGPQYAWANY